MTNCCDQVSRVINSIGIGWLKEVWVMKKISATDALELSIPERIQLVGDIWDTIAAQADSLELTEYEKK